MFEKLLTDPSLLFYSILRTLGLFLLLPILNSKNLGSALIRNVIILIFSIPIIPLFLDDSILSQINNIGSWSFVIQEIMIGAIIGFTVALPFWGLDSAGFIIDTLRGASIGTLINPSLGDSGTIMGILFVQLFTVLFFIIGGLNYVLDSLYISYQIIPPGTEINFGTHWLALIIKQWDIMIALSLGFVLPAVVIMILTDLGIGLMNRSAPQLNVFFIAMPIKSVLALLILIISIPFLFYSYYDWANNLVDTLIALYQKMIYQDIIY